MFLQTLFSFIIEKLYFEDNEKIANIHLFAFNLTTFLVLILSNLLISNTLVALLLTLGVLLIYIICLYVWQFEKFKIDFSFFKNFKYESANIISNFFMLIIYLFGFRIVFSAGEEYLVALNFVCLCTDTQWDMLDAISIATKIDISKGRFEYRRLVKNAYFYTLIVVLSSVIMTFSLFNFYNAKFIIVIQILIFQVIDMLFAPYHRVLSKFIQIEYSPALMTILSLVLKIVRTILSVVIISPYCTEIGQIVQGGLMFVSLLLIRFTKFRFEDNKLIIKQKK